jgi:hypothetical protein
VFLQENEYDEPVSELYFFEISLLETSLDVFGDAEEVIKEGFWG